MCDYSLHHVANRPAKVGDKLVTTRFRESSTRGFAAIGEPKVAMCLLPGTEIAFDREVDCDHGFGFLRNRKVYGKLARFVEAVSQSLYSRALGAMIAAEKGAILLKPVAHNAYAADLTSWSQRLDSAFKAVERKRLPVFDDLECFVVVVSAGFTLGHREGSYA